MKSRTPKTRWNLIVILIVFGALTYAVVKYFTPKPTPQSADIFLINPVSLTYGDTTIDGVIQKDSSIGQKGNYYLVLPDMRHILLNIQGLDKFIGLNVSVQGYLSPATENAPMTMIVISFTTK